MTFNPSGGVQAVRIPFRPPVAIGEGAVVQLSGDHQANTVSFQGLPDGPLPAADWTAFLSGGLPDVENGAATGFSADATYRERVEDGPLFLEAAWDGVPGVSYGLSWSPTRTATAGLVFTVSTASDGRVFGSLLDVGSFTEVAAASAVRPSVSGSRLTVVEGRAVGLVRTSAGWQELVSAPFTGGRGYVGFSVGQSAESPARLFSLRWGVPGPAVFAEAVRCRVERRGGASVLMLYVRPIPVPLSGWGELAADVIEIEVVE